ncbi:MFS transporter [Pseudactinotalea suaedae]|uniref:MFS transporter n=1 Tax=Pseudactinotalea suaedae TaxID=1524924 RepID=UPI0012E17AC3|nr:MFS transporter [Pseudactinotalea suaedae]
MSRLTERLLPARLGRPFRWLLGSSWVSNLGDGIVLAAGPLLVASLTDDARLVALGATLQWLPPLLFSLVAGVISDRFDRWRVMVTANALRIVVLAVLATAVLTGHVSISIVLPVLFLLGCAEVFVDNTSSTLVPMLVARKDLPVANARVMTGVVTLNQLAGPPVGAALFALGHAWPFASQILLVVAALVLLSRVRLPRIERTGERRHVRHDLAEGLRWAATHPAVRTLVLTIFIFNITFGAAWSVLVLYAQRQLGIGAIGFGLITTMGAIGGLVGTGCYGWLTRRVTLGNLMRIGLIIEALTHLALATTHTPWVAMVIFVVFGAHAFVWGTTSATIRQRVVPLTLQGRVNGVNSLGVFGGLVLGSTLGGLLAERYTVATPFWFAGIGSAVFVVLIWRQLRHLDQGDDDAVVEDAAPA